MKASWLCLLVLAGVSLLLTSRSEDASSPVSAAPEVATSHPEDLPIEASGISKAWWKKFTRESRGRKKPKTPRPGVYSPLSGNDPK